MRLIEDRERRAPAPNWGIRGVQLKDAAEGEVLAQELVVFAAISLKRHGLEAVSRIPTQVDPVHLWHVEEALAAQIQLAKKLKEVDDPATPIDFIPLDPYERTDRVSMPELSIPFHGVSGRVLAHVIEERRFELEPPISMAEIQAISGKA